MSMTPQNKTSNFLLFTKNCCEFKAIFEHALICQSGAQWVSSKKLGGSKFLGTFESYTIIAKEIAVFYNKNPKVFFSFYVSKFRRYVVIFTNGSIVFFRPK